MKNSIWHILKKDFGRLRYLIAILAGALLAKAILLYLVETHFYRDHPLPLGSLSVWNVEDLIRDNRTQSVLYLGIAGIVLSDFLALGALITWLLAEDSPLSERAFWRTRPIAGTQMFLAKAMIIALAAWPMQAAVQIATSMLAGYPVQQWLDGLEITALIQAVVVATVVIAASLWKNVFVGLGAILLFFAFGVFLLEYAWGNTGMELPVIGLLVAAVAVAWWMYAYRRRALGFALLGAIGLVCFDLIG